MSWIRLLFLFCLLLQNSPLFSVQAWRSTPFVFFSRYHHSQRNAFCKNKLQTTPSSTANATTRRSLQSLIIAGSIFLVTSLPASADSRTIVGKRYWDIMKEGTTEERVLANTGVMDYAVATINTMYFDATGGFQFQPNDFYRSWRQWMTQHNEPNQEILASRQGLMEGLQFLVAQLDPWSTIIPREERILQEKGKDDGFLGVGVMVEAKEHPYFDSMALALPPPGMAPKSKLLTARETQYLPMVTAVIPDSPAEHAGLVAGDKIIAVANDSFLRLNSREAVARKLSSRYNAENYLGRATLTIAKPVYGPENNVIFGYRPTRVKLTTSSLQLPSPMPGNDLVRYQLIQDSIFSEQEDKVGYIRLTQFSRAATAGFLQAIRALEEQEAQAYIIDLRNNYGGVVQEAMLTAASLLRDPHAILCYTMNSRGGFTPHEVEEYVVDTRYPGLLLSNENPLVSLQEIQRRGNPSSTNVEDGINWSPPSAYASLREQHVKRGIYHTNMVSQQSFYKNIVILVNEGTASSAEVFASALRDNGRAVALVGSKTFGKGLIQHTFPLPDGSGLRLTVAGILTPSLHHLTHVGGAQYDKETGRFIGGGIRPDIMCPSTNGIPRDVGSDFCVGLALDALQGATPQRSLGNVKHIGGSSFDETSTHRPLTSSILRDDF